MNITAPQYPPSASYVSPAMSTMSFDTRTVSINDLLAYAPAKTILVKEISGLESRLKTPQLVPHLSNFSLQDLVNFGALQTERLAEIDRQLRALPPLPASAS